MTTEIMRSERLVLRSASDDDLDTLYKIVFSDPEVMRHAFYGKVFNPQEAADFFQGNFDFDGSGTQAGVLELRETGEVIGFAGLLPTSVLGENDHEIGFVLGHDYWRKGYATEIGLAQIQYGFKVIKSDRLLGLALPENEASKLALMKIGMVYDTTVTLEKRGKREVYIIRNPAMKSGN